MNFTNSKLVFIFLKNNNFLATGVLKRRTNESLNYNLIPSNKFARSANFHRDSDSTMPQIYPINRIKSPVQNHRLQTSSVFGPRILNTSSLVGITHQNRSQTQYVFKTPNQNLSRPPSSSSAFNHSSTTSRNHHSMMNNHNYKTTHSSSTRFGPKHFSYGAANYGSNNDFDTCGRQSHTEHHTQSNYQMNRTEYDTFPGHHNNFNRPSLVSLIIITTNNDYSNL